MSAKFWELVGTEAGEEVRYYFNTSAGILEEDAEARAQVPSSGLADSMKARR